MFARLDAGWQGPASGGDDDTRADGFAGPAGARVTGAQIGVVLDRRQGDQRVMAAWREVKPRSCSTNGSMMRTTAAMTGKVTS
jgi:hypothetical protein